MAIRNSTHWSVWTLPPALGLGFCLAVALSAGPVLASGGGGSGGGGRTDMTVCPKGQVWDDQTKRCVPQQSNLLPDDRLTDYAFALAKAKRYDEALAVLDTLKNPNTAKALNYRGYATRKLGRTEEGIGYYLQSVALDPHYAQVREYLGEAYVIQGKLDLAKAQLHSIRAICGTKCEAYEDLSKAIAHPSSL
jgi:tetratricopeptide (TPR) repeat protein